MSSAVKSVNESRLEARSRLGFDFLFGLIPLLLLTPLLAIEFQSLGRRTAMTFFPIPVFVVACFAIRHWRSRRSDQPLRVLLARGLFLIGVVLFGTAVWRLSPLLAHGSFILLFSGWAIERLGPVAWPRILGWTALLATSMRLPGSFQTGFQNWLVQQSSAFLGSILDGLSIPYLIFAGRFSITASSGPK